MADAIKTLRCFGCSAWDLTLKQAIVTERSNYHNVSLTDWRRRIARVVKESDSQTSTTSLDWNCFNYTSGIISAFHYKQLYSQALQKRPCWTTLGPSDLTGLEQWIL